MRRFAALPLLVVPLVIAAGAGAQDGGSQRPELRADLLAERFARRRSLPSPPTAAGDAS